MVIINAKIVLIDRVIENGYLIIENNIIKSIHEGKYQGFDSVFDAKGNILMPGFIDIHTHGIADVDFMNATVEDYKNIEKYLFNEGVTTFLATTLTCDSEALIKVCETVKDAKKIATTLGGIHLEGPYISKKYKGAQNEEFIRNPNVKEIQTLVEKSSYNIKNITLAPELEGSLELIKYLKEKAISVSLGHSDASYKEAKLAFENGANSITHTTNGMNKIEGLVDAAKKLPFFSEFIADGVHVSKEVIKEYFDIIGADRFVLVTDSLKVKCSKNEKFELFGLPTIKKEDACYLTNGKLAGSILSMDKAVKNMKEWCNLSQIDLMKISSRNPAKAVHLQDLGEIREGYFADFVLLDDNLNVINIFKNGKLVK